MRTDRVPETAHLLGYAGLIPFAASALGCLFLDGEWAAFALRSLMGYGAVILSFVGAVHWGIGLAAAEPRPALALVWSNVPSLLGWAGLLVGGGIGLAVLVLGLLAAWGVDRTLVRRGRLPDWYGRLRTHLTTGAVLSLLAGFAV
ncbi:DUF3429 domain-containing protein [Azospirillum sp. SYSU D00513]|uniref:DUF3429 domain-containing protein n=1 Tax=Azospirillum sp. SYSU D00513 TaxID=2812561 RepID=UPI001A979071|nr:DUF3429 domain-containing protein [Azospirillum sp. SYSU D00513]